MKRKTLVTIIAIMICIVGATFAYFAQPKITAAVIEDRYSFTKAICTELNFCQDYVIVCNQDGIVDISPITGASIQQRQDWTDPRTPEEKAISC